MCWSDSLTQYQHGGIQLCETQFRNPGVLIKFIMKTTKQLSDCPCFGGPSHIRHMYIPSDSKESRQTTTASAEGIIECQFFMMVSMFCLVMKIYSGAPHSLPFRLLLYCCFSQQFPWQLSHMSCVRKLHPFVSDQHGKFPIYFH